MLEADLGIHILDYNIDTFSLILGKSPNGIPNEMFIECLTIVANSIHAMYIVCLFVLDP